PKDQVLFDGAIFRDPTSFAGTVFDVAPAFYGTTLNPETVFGPVEHFDRQFPDTSSPSAEKRYQTLKGLMGQQQALSEQLGFARLEMKAHAGRLPWWNLTHRLYGLLGDYGLSWERPLLWLAALTLALTPLYWHLMSPGKVHSQALLFSLSNAFPFVGSIRGVLHERLFDRVADPAVIGLLSLGQSVLSGIALFLIALGIRNRLRMK
ncbi:MAG: hypothetical protein J0653_06660, partial [Deltaproteobacteria bacterium]|nr:hypothetical protein [Deltaproteobacteria bacterium]